MHRPMSAAFLVASLIFLAPPSRASSGDPLERAKSCLARADNRAAVEALEEALPALSGERKAECLGLLKDAYRRAADDCERDGQSQEAREYRENLAILQRSDRPAPQQPPASAPPSRVAEPLAAPPQMDDPPVPLPRTRIPAIEPPTTSSRDTIPNRPADGPAADRGQRPMPDGLSRADESFRAGKYEDAGAIYGKMAADGRLPPTRRDHWAYCRCVSVVNRINAGPKPADWPKLQDEIAEIRELSPQFWFTEYLRNLAAERSGRPSPKKSDAQLARTAIPQPAPRAPGGNPPPPLSAQPANTPIPIPDPTFEPTAGQSANGWQVKQTRNFRILHTDADLADQVAEIAEATRDAQSRRWSGNATRADWTPRCDIYLYPTSKAFAQQTGQPEDSPGFSTMGLNAGKIVARRLNLRADHPTLLTAVLPHEVTHVILADLFPNQQIPRWADEGMAVLSEPESEQLARVADLAKPLASAKLFNVQQLMTMDYPDGRYWSLYYAQSVSLTQFLVGLGTPTQFVQFLQGSQRNGVEAELKKVYEIKNFADLHRRWLEHARNSQATLAASPGADRRVR